MPTAKQIREAVEEARKYCPGAQIKRVGPDGVEFVYPDVSISDDRWNGKPFGDIA